MAAQKIVIDTDIGTDADDSIAIALALASPELDIQAITVAGRQSFYRARIARRYLELAGRTDIKVFAGRDAPTPVPLTVACVFDRSFCTFEQLNLEIVVDPSGNIRPVRHPEPRSQSVDDAIAQPRDRGECGPGPGAGGQAGILSLATRQKHFARIVLRPD